MTFNDDFDNLYAHLQDFLFMAYELAVPRSLSAERIKFTSLVAYRKSMVFWVARKYKLLGRRRPNLGTVYEKMTETMQELVSNTT